MSQALFRFIDVRKSFGRRPLLRGADIELVAGRCALLVGRNGSGKSTLLRIMASLEPPDRASVDFGGGPLPWRRCRGYLQRHILYLHQQPYLFDGDVRYNLGYALKGGRDKRALVDAALRWGGLEALAGAPARSLSGGERQRLALARAWLRRPAVMLLDEPTANMDGEARHATLELLRALREEGYALLIASHDQHHFGDLFDARMALREGRVAQCADEPPAIAAVGR